ncbi:type 2 lanthipeptide synthetase LanM family protein [Lentzea sp. BCCO 10_0061]|uniref:Type 2 lanthipeptide synthetase LanM family protein n=1 Tax=Lentzea sokolovensis TaxID=3095429 RepID=A0ABU4UT08_9PSEU|nr:type 2 lanthipeptide synthetase LanM family protein [Lentzea sp. BCCO 10_0061]MDX8142144.1 type 2 lanthipeptide synthetase LanM family protein [Lentzea sp. BCCO 10_0061]
MEIACRATPAPTDVFAHVVEPWVAAASARLHAALDALPEHAVDPSALVASCAGLLTTRLTRLAAPALVHEMGQADDLKGADEHERFQDFLTRAHFEHYPVLVRELDGERDTAVEVITELATRYAADQDRLTGTLLDTKSALVAARPGGDRHRGGRATTVLELADGQRLVYKPRGVDAHLALTHVVELVNDLVDLGLATVKAVPGDGYGWTEHVEPAPLPCADATAYYLRLGGLLAVLHLLRATDMHHQNVITRVDQPLLIDVETLFQAQLPGERPDPAVVALGRSVARTGLLPAVAGRHGLVDISGVGGDAGQETSSATTEWLDAGTDRMRAVLRPEFVIGAANRPTWQGQAVEAADHADAVLSGFRQTYDAISLHSAEFAALLAGCASVPVRIVPRPTAQYAGLLAAARGPEFLRDAGVRLAAFTTACATDFLPGLAELEATELDTGDVPLFTTRADGHDLVSAKGKLPGVLATSGLEDALACLSEFDEFDRDDQEWVIAAALATRRVAVTGAGPGKVRQHAVGTDEVLSAACAIADRIVTTSYGTERINWIGLEPVGDTRWLVLPMGAGLAHGYTGVALFLAQLGRISEVCRYTDVARRALATVPDLLAALRGNDDLIAAVGSGGLTGFAGIGYGLARIATLLDDDEVARWARTTVRLASAAAEFEPEHGLAAAMRALDAEIGCSDARELAERYPDGPTGPDQWCQHDASKWTDDDLSLCHGELGHADVSVTGWSAATRHRRTGEVLATLRRDGPRCVTPDRVPTPGLLTGLAGLGMGLLRLGFPERTPSVLRFEAGN